MERKAEDRERERHGISFILLACTTGIHYSGGNPLRAINSLLDSCRLSRSEGA